MAPCCALEQPNFFGTPAAQSFAVELYESNVKITSMVLWSSRWHSGAEYLGVKCQMFCCAGIFGMVPEHVQANLVCTPPWPLIKTALRAEEPLEITGQIEMLWSLLHFLRWQEPIGITKSRFRKIARTFSPARTFYEAARAKMRRVACDTVVALDKAVVAPRRTIRACECLISALTKHGSYATSTTGLIWRKAFQFARSF
jgi:hypothetical protein